MAYRRALKEDLDWVTMKALEMERHRKYSTTTDLADQVDLYLAGKPVTVGPPGVLYGVRTFARKNRGLVTAALAVIVALLIGLVVSVQPVTRQ